MSGENQSSTSVTILDDLVFEYTEYFTLIVDNTSLPNITDVEFVLVNDLMTTVFIEDNERFTVGFEQLQLQQNEGSNVTLMIEASNVPAGGLAVDVTIDFNVTITDITTEGKC